MSSVGHSYPYPELLWVLCTPCHNTRGTGTAFFVPARNFSEFINTSYQKLPFGSGDYPDKLLFHQALNEVSNSLDRELPRWLVSFQSSRISLVELSIINTSYQKVPLALGTTSVSSARPRHNTRNVCEFCDTSIPIPETSGSSGRIPYPYPESTNPTEHNLKIYTLYS